jgi:hypothetical protein
MTNKLQIAAISHNNCPTFPTYISIFLYILLFFLITKRKFYENQKNNLT